MTQRGFLFLMAVAVLASLAIGTLIAPYTAPGLERTIWFAVCLAAVMYPAGLFAERRGWIRGTFDMSKRGKQPAAADTESAEGKK